MARGRGPGPGKSAAAQLGREIGEEVGRARGDSEADRPAPEAQPPTTKPWTDADRALVDDMRRLARARRAHPDFLAMERARRARMGQAVDDAAPLNDGLPTDPAARALLPPELLGHAPRRPPPAPRRPAKKRPRSMSEAAVFSDRLVALDEAQREEPEEEEPPVEEDEPDDYMRDYYDEDQDPVDGDGDEQVL